MVSLYQKYYGLKTLTQHINYLPNSLGPPNFFSYVIPSSSFASTNTAVGFYLCQQQHYALACFNVETVSSSQNLSQYRIYKKTIASFLFIEFLKSRVYTPLTFTHPYPTLLHTRACAHASSLCMLPQVFCDVCIIINQSIATWCEFHGSAALA